MIENLCENKLYQSMADLYNLFAIEKIFYFLFFVAVIILIYSAGYIKGRYDEFHGKKRSLQLIPTRLKAYIFRSINSLLAKIHSLYVQALIKGIFTNALIFVFLISVQTFPKVQTGNWFTLSQFWCRLIASYK